MKLRDAIAAGNMAVRVGALLLRTRTRLDAAMKQDIKPAPSDHPSDVTLRKALKHFQFSPVEIDHAVSATVDKREESDAQRIKAALTYLRTTSAKAR